MLYSMKQKIKDRRSLKRSQWTKSLPTEKQGVELHQTSQNHTSKKRVKENIKNFERKKKNYH